MDDRKERDREERIRRRAYQLWEEEGCPEGRSDVHWDKATELIAIEDNQRLVTEPIPSSEGTGPTGEPVEPLEAVENAGEFPTMTDQGEEQTYPGRRNRTNIAAGTKSRTVTASTPRPPRRTSAAGAASRSRGSK